MNGATGAFVWATSFGNASGDLIDDLTTDRQGNPIVTGSFSGSSMPLGATTLIGSNVSTARDVYVAKYDASGNLLWAAAAGGADSEIPEAVATDTAGNIYVCGRYDNSFSFAGTSFTLPNPGPLYAGGFVLKYNSGGIPQLGIPLTGTLDDEIDDIFIDRNDHILVTGYVSSATLSFNNVTLTSTSQFGDGFIAAYDNTGNALWADKISGSINECEITADTSGNIYLAGSFGAAVNFGVIPIVSVVNAGDIFLAKYGPCAATPLSQPSAITGSAAVCSGATQTYTVAPVPGAGIYQWTLPAGWSGSSLGNSITVTAGSTGGVISVAAASNCDTSQAQTLIVSVTAPPTATIMEGNTVTFCQGNTTTLHAVAGAGYSYQWATSSGAIAGATNTSYTTGQPGSYMLIVGNGTCSDTSASTTVTMLPSPTPVITQNGLMLSTAPNQGSYQWYKNYTAIPGATTNTYTVTQIGDYYVRVTGANNCAANSDTITITSVGIADIDKGGVNVYPQPAREYLTVEAPFGWHNPQIEITNLQGARVSFELVTLNDKAATLKITGAMPGVYFLSVKMGGLVRHEKILVQ